MTKTKPEYIMEILKKRQGLEPDDTSLDDELGKMSPRKAFSEVLAWKPGYSDWGNQITSWAEDCGLELSEDDLEFLREVQDV